MIQQVDPKVLAAGVTFVIALLEAARRFQQTGKIPIRQLPWTAKRQLFYWWRKSWFTVDKPDHPSFIVDRSASEVRECLAKQGFVPEWPLSYRYGGEVLNMRLFFYDPAKDLPHRQLHVRAFETDDGLEIMAHSEPTPEHHPKDHLESHDMGMEQANEWVRERLHDPVHVGYPSD